MGEDPLPPGVEHLGREHGVDAVSRPDPAATVAAVTTAEQEHVGSNRDRLIVGGVLVGALVAVVSVVLLSLGSEGPLTPLKAIILGAVEGFTEYLPVSSTGHLLVTQRLLGLDNEAERAAADSYVISIQIGAILAVVVLYWRRLGQIASGMVGRGAARPGRGAAPRSRRTLRSRAAPGTPSAST